MTTDLDTLLTALYVFCDDQLTPVDAYVLADARSSPTLNCSAWRWPRYCWDSPLSITGFAYGRLGHLFPYLPHQPGYHKRLTAAAPLILRAVQMLAIRVPSHTDQLRLIDATPLPCGTSRQTVKRSALADWANYGYCASHSRYYWGLKLYLVTALEGMPVV